MPIGEMPRVTRRQRLYSLGVSINPVKVKASVASAMFWLGELLMLLVQHLPGIGYPASLSLIIGSIPL
jgi:hypothetical protein